MGTSPVETLLPGAPLRNHSDGPRSAPSPPNQASVNARIWKWINVMQGYNLEIRHIPGKRNPADTLSRQDKKDALGRKTAVHDANADLVRELRVPSDADDSAIQEALMKLFNAQVQEQVRDQTVMQLKARPQGKVRAEFSFRSGPQGIRFSQRSDQSSPVQISQSQSPRPQDQFSSRPVYQYQAVVRAVIVH